MGSVILAIVTTLLGIAGTLAAIWLKYYLENRKKNVECIVQKTVIQDTEILNRLDEIREETGASRVSIMCFHNGGEYYSGRSVQKLSCAYESVSPGISRTQLSLQNIPVSSCLTTISNLIENREFHCYDVVQNYPDSGCRNIMIQNGVKSIYQYVILDLKRRAIGVLKAEFVLDLKELSDDEDDAMQSLSIKVSGYLTSH